MKKFSATSFFAVALFALANRSACALTVNVAEDASSTSTHLITAATGKATSLPVTSKQTAFVRFNLLDPTVVPPEINPTNITSATLRLYLVGIKPGDLSVHAVTAKWTETPLLKTGTAAPSVSGATIDTILSAETPGKHFITVDVTAAVKAAITGSTDYGFAIQTASTTAHVVLGSKEGPGTGVAAQLEIEANVSENASGNVTIPGTLAVSNAFTVESRPNSTGSSNVFIGINAGAADTTGFENTFVGKNAGKSNTGGIGNSFYGVNAGSSNTIGNHNVFVGEDAGVSNTSGANNSFVGHDAGSNNVSGGSNSFYGSQAGFSNTANGNSFFGASAGAINTTGQQNCMFGINAGFDQSTGSYNCFFGASAGTSSSTGDANVCLGNFAGGFNTTGSNNIFVGANTGNSISGESQNTLVGDSANGYPGNVNSTAIGANARVTASNSLVLGSISGVNGATADTSVGIGVTSPNSTLQLKGSLSLPVRTVNNSILALLTASDYLIVNTGSTATSIILPGAISGRVYVIKNKATVAATLGFAGPGLIEGAATLSIPSNTVAQVMCDGASWLKIN